MKTITQNLLHFVKKHAMSLTVLITLVGFQSQATNFNTNSKHNRKGKEIRTNKKNRPTKNKKYIEHVYLILNGLGAS